MSIDRTMSSSTIERRSSGSITPVSFSVTCSRVGLMGVAASSEGDWLKRGDGPPASRAPFTFSQTRTGNQTWRTSMAIETASAGILGADKAAEREELVSLLSTAYWMELETVMSYIANSINPDGVRAREVVEHLQEDVNEELGHAQQFGERIKELYGVVPGSMEFRPEQTYLQPPEQQTDVVHVIKGVIEAENGAIEHYNRIIEFTDGVDFVTQDMVIAILRDEEGHRRLFEGYLREYEAEGLA